MAVEKLSPDSDDGIPKWMSFADSQLNDIKEGARALNIPANAYFVYLLEMGLPILKALKDHNSITVDNGGNTEVLKIPGVNAPPDPPDPFSLKELKKLTSGSDEEKRTSVKVGLPLHLYREIADNKNYPPGEMVFLLMRIGKKALEVTKDGGIVSVTETCGASYALKFPLPPSCLVKKFTSELSPKDFLDPKNRGRDIGGY